MRFEFDSALQCWCLRRYAEVQAALRDSQRFGFGPSPGFDEAAHTRTLRAALDGFLQTRFSSWIDGLDRIPDLSRPAEIVSQFIEPWCHAAALQLVTLPIDQGQRLRSLAQKAFAFGARLDEPSADRESLELHECLPPVLGPLTVQAFVAVSQTLAAFLSSAAAALLESKAHYPHTPRAFEELLRYAGPSQSVFRYLNKPVGDLPKGTRVALLLAEANRDPEQFPQPEKLDFDRNSTGHLAFGYGLHACLGAMLIRAAAPVALRRLTPVLQSAELISIDWPAEPRIIRSPLSIRIREL